MNRLLAAVIITALLVFAFTARNMLLPVSSHLTEPALGSLSCMSATHIPRDAWLMDFPAEDVDAIRLLPRYTEAGVLCLPLPQRIRDDLQLDVASLSFEVEESNYYIPTKNNHSRPILSSLEGKNSLHNLRGWVKQAIEKWSNTENLEHTATYGPRTYREGSSLLPHVDRVQTHALSAIVHISSRDMREEWHLEVLPHERDFVHRINMSSPDNDVVLYESATIPHGRPAALNGAEYTNIFIHFRPSGWEEAVVSLLPHVSENR